MSTAAEVERDVCSFEEYRDLHADQVPFVINACYGGFGVSQAAEELLKDHHRDDGMVSIHKGTVSSVNRNSVFLAWLVDEKLRSAANGKYAKLEVHWVPSLKRPFYCISEYDGSESLCFKDDRFKAFHLAHETCHRLQAVESALEAGSIDEALKQVQHMRQELAKDAASLQVVKSMFRFHWMS